MEVGLSSSLLQSQLGLSFPHLKKNQHRSLTALVFQEFGIFLGASILLLFFNQDYSFCKQGMTPVLLANKSGYNSLEGSQKHTTNKKNHVSVFFKIHVSS